jgi:sugar lactone lactonase YvrE
MRRFLTLVLLLGLALPVGVSISGCYRNPAGNYCNGLGYGLKDTDLYAITLQPQTAGLSLAFGQTKQITSPTAVNCKGGSVSVSSYSYGTTNNKLVDISPSGNICAGTWNRNSGGGIADYTVCNYPSPSPTTNGAPYATASISATANSVTSNPVTVYVHAQVTSLSLALENTTGTLAQGCFSQGVEAQLDAEGCYAQNGKQYELCAPALVSSTAKYACSGGLAPGVTSVPNCSSAIGTLSFYASTPSVATINTVTNQITAEQPGTTVINASVAGSGSSSGYFTTCPPANISLSLNGATTGTVTQGVTQNLTTTVTDTKGQTITGLTLDYQSTNPLDISALSSGGILASYPGSASIYAVCQPATCNPSPINTFGQYGAGLSISSNSVDVTTPGTASSYVWYSAPGQSQYFVPVELLTGTVGSTVRLPYVPNSMVMDGTGANLYFGSSHELMVYSTTSNSLASANPNVPGVVLAVSPTASTILVNDQAREVFYIYNTSGTIAGTFGGLGVSAQYTPDGKTLYVTDSAAAGGDHIDALYVYNANTGWTTYTTPQYASTPAVYPSDLGTSPAYSSQYNLFPSQNLAITVPSVGAFIAGNSATVARTWCPSGTVGNYNTMEFYPPGATVNATNSVLVATKDGNHILGASTSGGAISLSDIGVTIPNSECPVPAPGVKVTIPTNLNHTTVPVNATAVDQIVTSPVAVASGTSAASNSLNFITYSGTTAGAALPYYLQTTGATSALGKVGTVTLTNNSAITAPLAGAFSPDGTLFFVSTAGDNMIHYIDTTTLKDTQQISPNLPACTPGSDPGCLNTSTTTTIVPATVITTKPRATT